MLARNIHVWTDSTTTKHWLEGQPYRWKTFVANPVSETICSALEARLHFCPGQDNLAELVSRGASLGSLKDPQWRSGPPWLPNPASWPCGSSFKFAGSMPSLEEDAEVFVTPVLLDSAEVQWWNRYSKWTRVVGVVQCLLKWRNHGVHYNEPPCALQ